MDRNLLLGILGIVAVGVVGAVMVIAPEEPSTRLEVTKEQSLSSSSDVSIHIQSQSSSSSQTVKRSQKSSKASKPDPSIKAAAVDHYHTYLIQLIDKNPEDRDIQITKDPKSYVYVDGKVDGKDFVMKVPKAIVDRPGIELKITNLKTKKVTTIDASFLAEIDSMPPRGSFRVKLNTQNPEDIQTEMEPPEEYPPFPTMTEE